MFKLYMYILFVNLQIYFMECTTHFKLVLNGLKNIKSFPEDG